MAGTFPAVWGLVPIQQLMLLILLTAIGYVGPSFYVDRRLARRKAAITRALPDALDLMVVCVEAGLGINQAMARVAQEFEAKSPAERWEYFTAEVSRCIRCYACRQACPNCYCKVCFVDQTKPSWIGKSDDLSETVLYHIGRIFHQAGRCVECDACVRACPMNIDLRIFTQKLGKDVAELYEYVPAFSAEEPPPLCAFKPEDSEGFITEP